MLLPLLVNTRSAMSIRDEFVLCVIAAVASSGGEGYCVAALIGGATSVSLSTYTGDVQSMAYNYLIDTAEATSDARVQRCAERAASGLLRGGATRTETVPVA